MSSRKPPRDGATNDSGGKPHARKKPPNKIKALAKAERIRRAIELSCAGKTPKDIAEDLGVNRTTVYDYLDIAQRKVDMETKETVEEIRAGIDAECKELATGIKELMAKAAKLFDEPPLEADLMQISQLLQAINGQHKNLVAVWERRAKMHGIDSSTQKIEIDVNLEVSVILTNIHSAGMAALQELSARPDAPEPRVIEAAAEVLDIQRTKVADLLQKKAT